MTETIHISKAAHPNLDIYIWLAPFSQTIHDYITSSDRQIPSYNDLFLAYCDVKRSNGVKLTSHELKEETKSYHCQCGHNNGR